MTVSQAKPADIRKPSAVADIPQIMRQKRFVPWMYLGPALFIMAIFIAYPTINTAFLSLRNVDGTAWATASCTTGQPCWGIFENYHYALTNSVMLQAFGNNLVWLVLMVGGCVLLGLLIALLANRVKYEAVAKSIIFLPMAISFVGAGVIWKFIYSFNASGTQIGLLNALLVALGGQPVSWLTQPQVNTLALIVVGVWMSTGFCMVITSAAIKNVPADILEAARVDGANAWRTFWNVILPTIMPTLIVVTTTMVINVLKIFDIVYVMTGGLYGTDVIANRMYKEQYQAFNTGRAAAIATVLIIVVLPAMYINIRRFRNEEKSR